MVLAPLREGLRLLADLLNLRLDKILGAAQAACLAFYVQNRTA